jgi:hypothetical protein
MQITPESLDEVITGTERRSRERRTNIAQYRLVSRALAMRRTFGTETALAQLGRMKIGPERARQILAIAVERRQRRRRY